MAVAKLVLRTMHKSLRLTARGSVASVPREGYWRWTLPAACGFAGRNGHLRTLSVPVRGRAPRNVPRHGHIADSAGPIKPGLAVFIQVDGYVAGWEREYCKTVGSAYVGSNPTPATTCENGPLAAETRPGGPFPSCPAVCHRVPL